MIDPMWGQVEMCDNKAFLTEFLGQFAERLPNDTELEDWLCPCSICVIFICKPHCPLCTYPKHVLKTFENPSLLFLSWRKSFGGFPTHMGSIRNSVTRNLSTEFLAYRLSHWFTTLYCVKWLYPKINNMINLSFCMLNLRLGLVSKVEYKGP